MTRLRPQVVRFIEAQTLLTLSTAQATSAEYARRNADAEFRRAWDALTPSETRMVNDACLGLNEPERYADV